MKSPSKSQSERQQQSVESKQEQLEQFFNQALDQTVNQLDDVKCADIAQVRKTALQQLHKKTVANSPVDNLKSWLINPLVNVGVPVAAALMIAISMKYATMNTIPELPLAMMASDIPNEDFAMLEDLEFVAWLAENEKNSLL